MPRTITVTSEKRIHTDAIFSVPNHVQQSVTISQAQYGQELMAPLLTFLSAFAKSGVKVCLETLLAVNKLNPKDDNYSTALQFFQSIRQQADTLDLITIYCPVRTGNLRDGHGANHWVLLKLSRETTHDSWSATVLDSAIYKVAGFTLKSETLSKTIQTCQQAGFTIEGKTRLERFFSQPDAVSCGAYTLAHLAYELGLIDAGAHEPKADTSSQKDFMKHLRAEHMIMLQLLISHPIIQHKVLFHATHSVFLDYVFKDSLIEKITTTSNSLLPPGNVAFTPDEIRGILMDQFFPKISGTLATFSDDSPNSKGRVGNLLHYIDQFNEAIELLELQSQNDPHVIFPRANNVSSSGQLTGNEENILEDLTKNSFDLTEFINNCKKQIAAAQATLKEINNIVIDHKLDDSNLLTTYARLGETHNSLFVIATKLALCGVEIDLPNQIKSFSSRKDLFESWIIPNVLLPKCIDEAIGTLDEDTHNMIIDATHEHSLPKLQNDFIASNSSPAASPPKTFQTPAALFTHLRTHHRPLLDAFLSTPDDEWGGKNFTPYG